MYLKEFAGYSAHITPDQPSDCESGPNDGRTCNMGTGRGYCLDWARRGGKHDSGRQRSLRGRLICVEKSADVLGRPKTTSWPYRHLSMPSVKGSEPSCDVV